MFDRTDQADNSIDENQNNEIAKLFLKKIDEQSNDFKDEKVCYNCDEKKTHNKQMSQVQAGKLSDQYY